MSTATVEAKQEKRTTGYGRKPSTYDAMITEVGAGTPLGEFMRRYWHPVAIAEKVQDVPQKLRVLGEDLVIFR
ncbi:MAG: aromatic ring-hydroxylating dioxygenase subunit alpha, partial [Hyphomicrobiales bacterium]|nr:aromatic ring-hydroxylating dioxygenase subunit alpha [Hyphomicrobiales bacterium]